MTAGVIAPVPDFRYVGLEPLPTRQLGVAGVGFALGAGVTVATSSVVAGLAVGALAAFTLRGARRPTSAPGGVRMGIVPWGVLVHIEDAPRVLRWAAVKRLDIATSRTPRGLWRGALSSRVVVQTEHDRFVGTAMGAVELDQLVENLKAYADEQSTPVALDLDGAEHAEVAEPECEALLVAVRAWLGSAAAVVRLGLPPSGYRRASSRTWTAHTVEVLRSVLRDRTPKTADPRAFAAVVAADVHAAELLPDLIALTQCPHPVVAAVARQAAHRLGAARARVGTLDEVAPFLFEGDRTRLESWSAL